MRPKETYRGYRRNVAWGRKAQGNKHPRPRQQVSWYKMMFARPVKRWRRQYLKPIGWQEYAKDHGIPTK